MKIIKQELSYECGICCLKMLIDYYYKNNNITKECLLSKTSISSNGLSILNLEILAMDYNIQLESYKANYEEIFKLKPKKPFILVFYINNLLHYVVGILKEKKLLIYDPANKVSEYDINNPPENFANILILSDYLKIKLNKINPNVKHWYLTSSWYILIMTVLVIISFSLMVIINFFVSKLLTIINKSEILSLIGICGWLVLFMLFQYGYNYLMFLIEQWYNKKTYFYNLNYFKTIISDKTNNFYQIINTNEFIFFYQILKQYLTFINNYLITIFKTIIIFATSFILIGVIDYRLLFFCLPLTIINGLLLFYQNQKEYNFNQKMLQSGNEISNNLYQINEFLKINYNNQISDHQFEKTMILIKSYENTYYQFNRNNFHINSWIKTILNIINLGIFIFITLCYPNNGLSKMSIFMGLITLNQENFNGLINIFLDKRNFSIVKKILINIISLNNLRWKNNDIKCYGINNINIDGKNISSLETIEFYQFHLFDYLYDNEILINNINIKEYDKQTLFANIKYINDDKYLFDENILVCIDKTFEKSYTNFINTYRLNLNQPIKNKLLNFINHLFTLTKWKNKLIFLECYYNMNININLYNIVKQIISYIAANNIVIFINNNFLNYEKNHYHLT